MLDVFSPASNAAVVRAPGRRFPGIVVQGDTLLGLVHSARVVSAGLSDGLSAGADADLAEEAAALADHLQGLLDVYTAVLDRHGHPLPFPR